MIKSFEMIKQRLNPSLEINGILFTMYDTGTNLSTMVVKTVKEDFKYYIYETIIPRDLRLAEAPSHGKSIFQYDPGCVGAQKYFEMANEFVKRSKSINLETIEEGTEATEKSELDIAKENAIIEEQNFKKDAMVLSDNTGKITPQQIMDAVCEHMHVKPEAIKSRKRSEDIAIPRLIVMYLCAKYTDCSITMIGEFLGRDNYIILHGVSKMENDIENYDFIRNTVEIIKKKLNIT